MKLQIDIRVEVEIDEEDVEDYESYLHAARESRMEIAHACREDEFEILSVVELDGPDAAPEGAKQND